MTVTTPIGLYTCGSKQEAIAPSCLSVSAAVNEGLDGRRVWRVAMDESLLINPCLLPLADLAMLRSGGLFLPLSCFFED